MTLRKAHLGDSEVDLTPVFGAEAVSLVHRADELQPCGSCAARLRTRADPLQVRPQASDMIELPDDFRDLLLALCDAGAEFVVVGG